METVIVLLVLLLLATLAVWGLLRRRRNARAGCVGCPLREGGCGKDRCS